MCEYKTVSTKRSRCAIKARNGSTRIDGGRCCWNLNCSTMAHVFVRSITSEIRGKKPKYLDAGNISRIGPKPTASYLVNTRQCLQTYSWRDKSIRCRSRRVAKRKQKDRSLMLRSSRVSSIINIEFRAPNPLIINQKIKNHESLNPPNHVINQSGLASSSQTSCTAKRF